MARTLNATPMESHPMRQKAIDAMLADQTLQQISSWMQPKVSVSTLCRWRMKIQTKTQNAQRAVFDAIANNDRDLHGFAMETAKKAAVAVAVDPFIARVQELRAQRQEVKDACLNSLDTPDVRTWAALDRNDLAELEIHAKLAGRYSDGSQTTINIVVPMVPQPAVQPADFEVIDIKPAQ